jgi:hypothetical protein
MAKLGRPKKVTQVENGETTSGYFRRIVKEAPHLLVTRSNDEMLARWLTDHPGQKEVPKNVHKNLAKIKGVLRHKGRKKHAKPKTVEQAVAVQAISTPLKPTRIAPKGLEGLEEQIDDALTVAKRMDREGLADVIRLLRNARNGVVWQLGA